MYRLVMILLALLSTLQIRNAAGAAASARGGAEAGATPHAPIIASPDIYVPRAHPTREYWVDKMPAGNGRSVIVQKCQLCHDMQRTLAAARPRDQWQHVVEAMIRRGSPVAPDEVPPMVDYLARYFGPDSPVIPELGRRACKRGDWPKGSSEFRRRWKGAYNIWVSNQQDGSIDIVDSANYRIVNRIGCVTAPDRVEFSHDGDTAYVPDRVEHNITVIDTRTGAFLAKIPLLDRPNSAAVSRDSKRLYVGIWPLAGDEDRRGYIQVIDTATLKITRTIRTKGGIHLPWMSPDGKLLLALSSAGKFMDVYDTATDRLLYTCCSDAEVGTMNVEPGPDGSSRRLFFSYVNFNGVVIVDAHTGKELGRAANPDMPAMGFHGSEISPDGRSYWFIQFSKVYRFDVPSLKPSGVVPLSLVDQVGNPFSAPVEGNALTISPDGRKVYALRGGRNLMSVIDVATMREEALVPTGQYGLHVSIWPRGTP